MRKIDSKQKLESGLERLRMILGDMEADAKCREKRQKYDRQYYREHREKILERQREYRARNKALAAGGTANKGKQ